MKLTFRSNRRGESQIRSSAGRGEALAPHTISRAIGRWRKLHGKPANAPVTVREFRIARKQPRPMPPDP